MFASNPGTVYPGGERKDIAYMLPKGPPDDYGDFRDANIMLINTKSEYKPFTIGLPYGVKVQPYAWEDDESYPFTTWKGYEEPGIGYISAIGHMLNFWHFRRTSDTLEQIYLHGLTNQADPQEDLLKLAWSWIAPPELQIPGEPLSPNGSAGQHNVFTFDQAQKAYVIPRKSDGPERINFVLDAIYDDAYLEGTMWLINPAFVVPNWNETETSFQFELDGETLSDGVDYRYGYESTTSGKDLVIWLNRTIDLNEREEHNAKISINPIGK